MGLAGRADCSSKEGGLAWYCDAYLGNPHTGKVTTNGFCWFWACSGLHHKFQEVSLLPEISTLSSPKSLDFVLRQLGVISKSACCLFSLFLCFLGLVLLSILWAYILCFMKSWRSRGGEGMLIMHLPANLKNFLGEYMRVLGLTLVTTSTLLMLLCLESRWETQTTQHLLGPVSHASL